MTVCLSVTGRRDCMADARVSVKDRVTDCLARSLPGPLYPPSVVKFASTFLIFWYVLKRNKSFIKVSLSVKDRLTGWSFIFTLRDIS